MFEIEIQIPNASLGEVQDYCKHFGCQAMKTKTREFYKITTTDIINFYWLGANINNKLLNQLVGTPLSKFVEL